MGVQSKGTERKYVDEQAAWTLQVVPKNVCSSLMSLN